MPKASEVAAGLRMFADSLDRDPDAEISSARVSFFHSKFMITKDQAKQRFLALARLIPRPIKKGEDYNGRGLTLKHETDAVLIYAAIDKSLTREPVTPARPAEYRCVSILSPEEEAEMSA